MSGKAFDARRAFLARVTGAVGAGFELRPQVLGEIDAQAGHGDSL